MKITSPLTEILIKEVLICAKNNSVSNHVQLGGSQHSLHHKKNTPAFTSSPLNSYPNTIETVMTPFHPSLYIQPNTLLLPNTRVKLHTSFSIVHFHKTKALNPGDNQSILETDIDFFFLPGHVQMFSLSCCTRTPMRIQQRYMHMEWKHIYAPIDAKTALTIQNYLTSHCSVRSISRRASSYVFCTIALIQKEFPFTTDFGC